MIYGVAQQHTTRIAGLQWEVGSLWVTSGGFLEEASLQPLQQDEVLSLSPGTSRCRRGAFSDCCCYSLSSSLLIRLIARRKSLLGANVSCMPLEFSAVWKGQPQAGLQAAEIAA